jgi:exopolyphosphatase/guanosine-5'-triphosphate,3'-diphosphate pyrophosphatase
MTTAPTTPAASPRRPAVAPPQAGGAPPSLRLAAIDVGSNSIHMIVAQADADGGLTTLWRMKEMVGLGRMSFPSHRLSRDAMDRAIQALGRFKQAAQLRQAEKIVAVATSAIREAVNGGDFIERAKRDVGLYVRVVSAREEARLIYLAVRHAIDLGTKPHLIVDIGGGSVEFIVGDARKAQLLESRKLGAARMTAKYVASDPITPDERDALLRHYDRELKPLVESIAALKPVKVIGTSGTLENLAAMTGGDADARADDNGNGHGPAGAVIARKPLDKLVDGLLESRSKDRAKMRGLDDQRKDQITAGALLVREMLRRLDVKKIELCPSALREGILLDYLARHIPDLEIRSEVPDPRRRSVIDLARRCDWNQTHSEHVAMLALKLFDELRPLHGLGTLERELIEYAALLHDIGWHIGRKGHHKHSAYLIRHGDLKDFSQEEVAAMANIARYHRKAIPTLDHAEYAALSKRARRIVDVGAALLRLADGLDRSHSSVVTNLRCRIEDSQVRCSVTARVDAELELWGARRKKDCFNAAFKRDVVFVLARGRR